MNSGLFRSMFSVAFERKEEEQRMIYLEVSIGSLREGVPTCWFMVFVATCLEEA